MLKHYSPNTRRLERCRAQAGACRFNIHGAGISDVQLLNKVLEQAAQQEDTETFLTIREQISLIEQAPQTFDAELPTYKMEDEQERHEELRRRYQTVAKGGVEFHLAPEDNSHHAYCYSCTGPVADRSTEDNYHGVCLSCGEESNSPEDFGTLLRRSELIYFSDDMVKTSSWYHTSDRPDWEEAVKVGKVQQVHAGSWHSAEDRVSGLKREHGETWMYELRLKPDATIDPHVYAEDPNYTLDWQTYPQGKYSAHRYQNMYEDAGTISLLLHYSQFDIIARHKVTR